jgi:hypothetical protein
MPNSATTKNSNLCYYDYFIVAAIIIIIGDGLLIIRHTTLLNFYGSMLVNEEDFI